MDLAHAFHRDVIESRRALHLGQRLEPGMDRKREQMSERGRIVPNIDLDLVVGGQCHLRYTCSGVARNGSGLAA